LIRTTARIGCRYHELDSNLHASPGSLNALDTRLTKARRCGEAGQTRSPLAPSPV
jgi:hypothetical protein